MTWTVTGAWPKKWSVGDLSAETSAIAVESLDLSYRYFRIG
jgi:phage tail-like protein